MSNMFLVRALFIRSVILVCIPVVSDIGPAVLLLAFAVWELTGWAGAFRIGGDTHQRPKD